MKFHAPVSFRIEDEEGINGRYVLFSGEHDYNKSDNTAMVRDDYALK